MKLCKKISICWGCSALIQRLKMANKKLKKIMTDLAAGHITKQQAESLTKGKKVENSKAKTPKKQLNIIGGKNHGE